MPNIFEMYGRLAEEHEAERLRHMETNKVLFKVKSGEISLDSLDVTEHSWTFTPEAETDSEVAN